MARFVFSLIFVVVMATSASASCRMATVWKGHCQWHNGGWFGLSTIVECIPDWESSYSLPCEDGTWDKNPDCDNWISSTIIPTEATADQDCTNRYNNLLSQGYSDSAVKGMIGLEECEYKSGYCYGSNLATCGPANVNSPNIVCLDNGALEYATIE